MSRATTSSVELDAEHVRRRRFTMVRRGFDPVEVCSFLAAIAERLEQLEREIAATTRNARGPLR